MFKYFTLDSFDFRGKVVGLRVDINSPQINGKIVLNERIIQSCETIKELVDKGAKIVILAHQGRKGKDDFVSLKEHSVLLEKELKHKVDFENDIYSKKIMTKIFNMRDSDVLLLENVRFYDEKEPKKSGNKILKLEELFDFYVFDAFSVSHREHTSVVGFKKIPNVAGRLIEKEIQGLNKISSVKSPKGIVFGGAKPEDLYDLFEYSLNNKSFDMIFLTGVIAEVALLLKGYDLGCKLDFLEKKGYLEGKERLKRLLDKYPDKIFLPNDLALSDGKKRIEINVNDLEKKKKIIDKYMIQDIGSNTFKMYSLMFKRCNSIYFKGPSGNFEVKEFQKGTKGILKGIVDSGAFSYLGGGHSVTSVKDFGFMKKISYVSLAGGAIVKYLSGQTLVGVKNLEDSFHKYEGFEDFVVVGSNVSDIGLDLPCKFSDVRSGDKVRIKEDFKETIGGGGINVSICLSRLGAKVGYLGKFSHDNFDKVKNFLEKNKVQIIKSKISKKPAAKSVVLDTEDNDRVILTYRGQNPYLDIKDFDIESFKANSYYLTALQDDSLSTQIKMVKKVKKRNPRAVFCYNPSCSLVKNYYLELKQLIKLCDILILNYEEAQKILKHEDLRISPCLKGIYDLGPNLVIITDGHHGAYAYDGKSEHFVKAVKANKILDTTGAGDSYGGTFFYFYRSGFGLKKSMEFAAINASSVISKKGSLPGLKYFDDLVK